MEIPDMNAATKPTKFPETAWTERWTVSKGGQQPSESAVIRLQRLDSPRPNAMNFAEAAVP